MPATLTATSTGGLSCGACENSLHTQKPTSTCNVHVQQRPAGKLWRWLLIILDAAREGHATPRETCLKICDCRRRSLSSSRTEMTGGERTL